MTDDTGNDLTRQFPVKDLKAGIYTYSTEENLGHAEHDRHNTRDHRHDGGVLIYLTTDGVYAGISVENKRIKSLQE